MTTQSKNIIHLAIAADDNFAQHLCVTLVSVLANLDPSRLIKIYILDGGISQDKKNKIDESLRNFKDNIADVSYFSFSEQDFSGYKESKGITKATYYRIQLPALLPDVSKVIYLDSDIVVVADISELFDLDIGDAYAAAVKDPNIEMAREYKMLDIKSDNGYFNSGVLVLNLQKFREQNLSEKIVEWLRVYNFKSSSHDQTALNAILVNKWIPVSPLWNQTAQVTLERNHRNSTYSQKEFQEGKRSPKVIHYTSRFAKPWKYQSIGPHKSQYYKYLAMTEFRDYKAEFSFKALMFRTILYIYFRILPNSMQRAIKYAYAAI